MTEQTIAEWVKDNAEGLMPDQFFSGDDLQHITMCCEHLLEGLTEGRPLGNFLTAVASNDLIEANIRADGVNRRALYLYVMFMLNRVPSDKIRRDSNSIVKELLRRSEVGSLRLPTQAVEILKGVR